ncbi:MAG: hypothetical protein AAGD07_06595 [Planctomycetota bacterium]
MKHYCVSLASLLVLMGVYQSTVTLWLIPEKMEQAPVAARPIHQDDGSLQHWFSESDWQRGRCIRLKTDDGVLLFQDWEQEGPKKWRLWPIAIVIGQNLSEASAEPPIMVHSREGARIEFTDALDITSGRAPGIRSGEILGNVSIKRDSPAANPPSHASKQRASSLTPASVYQTKNKDRRSQQRFEILTSKVGIDNHRIWTTAAIHMRFGRASLVGRDLTLHLATSTPGGTGGNGRRDLSGALDRLELIYLREILLPLDDFRPSPGPSSEGWLQLRCNGRIEYDFALDQLALNREVRLTRHRNETAMKAEQASDWFHCHSLQLTLRDPMNADRPRTTALDWIDRVAATGYPLSVHVDEQSLDVAAGELLFDPVEGVFDIRPMATKASPVATGRNKPRSIQTVHIQHGRLQSKLSALQYRFDPKQPRMLGKILALGPGRMLDTSPESMLREFTWDHELEITSTSPTTLEQIDQEVRVVCEGKPTAKLQDGGSFAADWMQMFLKPPASGEPQRGDAVSEPGRWDSRLLPDRFAAGGDVHIRSKWMDVATPLLQLYFQHQSPPPITNATGPSDANAWVKQPAAARDATRPEADLASPKPKLHGERVSAQITLHGERLHETDISVVGDVRVLHRLAVRGASNATGPNWMDAELTGATLRFRDGPGNDVLQLSGPPGGNAKLTLDDGYFVGPQIQVLPDLNQIRMDRAGSFVVPSGMLPTLSSDERGTPSHWTRPPEVQFGSGMAFDGTAVKLLGGVDLHAGIAQAGIVSDLRIAGEELHLMLSQGVEINQPKSFRQTGLSEIVVTRGQASPVTVDLRRYNSQGELDSRHHFAAPRLTWRPGRSPTTTPTANVSTQVSPGIAGNPIGAGQLEAPGPGEYFAWLPGSLSAAFEREEKIAATQVQGSVYDKNMLEGPTRRDSGQEPSITGIHLLYQGELRSDIQTGDLVFHRGVRIGVRPMPDFQERFDARQMNLISNGEMTLDSQRLRLAVDPVQVREGPERVMGEKQATAWEVSAEGGVVFRNRSENGLAEFTADRCAYAAVKDLVTLQGSEGRPAQWFQKNQDGTPRISLALRHATIRLSTMELLSSQIERLQVGALPGIPSSTDAAAR